MLSGVLVLVVSPALPIDLDAYLCADFQWSRHEVDSVEVPPNDLPHNGRLPCCIVLAFAVDERNEPARVARLSAAFGEEHRVEELDLPLLSRRRIDLAQRALCLLSAAALRRWSDLVAPRNGTHERLSERVDLAAQHPDVALLRKREGERGVTWGGREG